MIPRTLRELIQASKRTARELKQALEDVGELIRDGQLEQGLQKQPQPVRVPVRSGNQHPLARNSNRRHFSTARVAQAAAFNSRTRANFKFSTNFSDNAFRRAFKQSSTFNTFKTAFYQSQINTGGFGFIGKSQGRIGKGLFSCFPKHNARMFSTFSPNATHQIVENLSQNIRMFFLKGGKLSKDMMHSESGSTPYELMNQNVAEDDLRLASKFSDVKQDSGCFIEFDFSTPLCVPESGIFDDESSINLESVFEYNMNYQVKILQDIKTFKETIGSTSFRYNKAKNRIRFYCPNCDVMKMEGLLKDANITTGVVYKNNEINDALMMNENSTAPELISPSSSSFESSLSSDYSDLDSDIISSSMESVGDYYYVMNSAAESNILSTSEEQVLMV